MKKLYIFVVVVAIAAVIILIISFSKVFLNLSIRSNESVKLQSMLVKSTSRPLHFCAAQTANVTRLLEAQKERHKKEIEELKRNLLKLYENIRDKTAEVKRLSKDTSYCQDDGGLDGLAACDSDPLAQRLLDYVKNEQAHSVDKNTLYHLATPQTNVASEYEAVHWETFTSKHFYHMSDGIASSPRQKLQREQSEVISLAVKLSNEERNSSAPVVTSADLFEGSSLINRTQGSLYELYFDTPTASAFRNIKIVRPFAAVKLMGNPTMIDLKGRWINIILTLQGRIDRFESFVKMYVDLCVKKDKHVFLTVVYFGTKQRKEAEMILKKMEKQNRYAYYKFLSLESTFSRGRGLQYGVEQINDANALMFFCDVDIVFNNGFLDRCRMHAQTGKRVYFPVVFSLYNPDVVYESKQKPPDYKQLVIKHETGMWRKYGYGMTCLYRSDFFSVGGFDLNIEGWGGEDVDLLRRFKCSSLEIMRSVDRGIFHLYHPKLCDPGLSVKKYGHCIGNRAVYEASHRQLGLMVMNLTGNEQG